MKTSEIVHQIRESTARKASRYRSASVVERGHGFDRFKALREFYANANFEIMAAGKTKWGIDPYEVDWIRVFTPIEQALWHDIRDAGIVMYPQYPVCGFFLDFANPRAMVGIECDGAAYHSDKQKDANRDAELSKLGWRIYRISGSDCKSNDEDSKAKKFVSEIAKSHELLQTRY